MLFNRAEMYNRRAAQPQFKAREVISLLDLKEGCVVADIGSGGGFFTTRFSEAVGETGKVYAVDTNEKLLAYIEKKAREHDMKNIATAYVGKGGPNFPPCEFDLVFMRNVFHHLKEPVSYFKTLLRSMRPEGRVAILDYKKGVPPGFIKLMGHYVDEGLIVETMAKAGYEPARRYDLLPEQSFNIFKI